MRLRLILPRGPLRHGLNSPRSSARLGDQRRGAGFAQQILERADRHARQLQKFIQPDYLDQVAHTAHAPLALASGKVQPVNAALDNAVDFRGKPIEPSLNRALQRVIAGHVRRHELHFAVKLAVLVCHLALGAIDGDRDLGRRCLATIAFGGRPRRGLTAGGGRAFVARATGRLIATALTPAREPVP